MPPCAQPGPLHVAALMHLDAAARQRICAVDPRVRLRTVSKETMTWLRRRRSWDDDPDEDTLQDARARREFEEVTAQAEVWFSPAFRAVSLRHAGPLRWAQFWTAGVDRVLAQRVPAGIVMTTASGLHAATIAEWNLAFMLSHAKRLPLALEQQQAACWKGWTPAVLRGRTVGIVGLGAIGRETARLCAALGMHVVATKRSARPGDPAPHCDTLYPIERLPTLLAESDYVILAAPLTPETREMIGASQLAAMKPSGVLINIARGALVDWRAVLDALRDGAIAAYYTDVTVPEPLSHSDPAWRHANLFITPHVAGNLDDYLEGATAIFADNLHRYISGEPLRNQVDMQRGY